MKQNYELYYTKLT